MVPSVVLGELIDTSVLVMGKSRYFPDKGGLEGILKNARVFPDSSLIDYNKSISLSVEIFACFSMAESVPIFKSLLW